MASAAAFSIGQGSLLPVLEAVLYADGSAALVQSGAAAPSSSKTPADLTGATLTFRLIRNGLALFEADAATVGLATAGRARYTWAGSDTAIFGMLEGEFVATFTDGRQQTFPGCPFFSIYVKPRFPADPEGLPTPDPKRFAVYDTVDDLTTLLALDAAALLPGRTFYRVRGLTGWFALDVASGAASPDSGVYASTDSRYQWFNF